MNRRSLPVIAVALALAAVTADSGRATPARVQNLQAISGPSPVTQPCELGVEYEPQIAVNPKNPDNIVAVWIEGDAQAIVAAVSKDGGRTWTPVLVPAGSGCSGVLREDPRLAFDADGTTLYLASLCDSGCTEDPSASDLVVVRRSTDGGLTWNEKPPYVVTRHIPEGCADECFNAEVSITADPKKPGHAYVVWTRQNHTLDTQSQTLKGTPPWPAYLSQTVDGGDHWSTPTDFYHPANSFPLLHDIRVLPDRSLLDVFVDYHDDCDGVGTCKNTHQMALHLTTDGQPLPNATEIAKVPDIKASDPETGLSGQGVVKPAFDVAPDGTAYVAWQDIEPTTSSIRIAKSTDAGAHWTELTPVRRPGLGAYNDQAFQPMLAVGPRGIVGVTYYDFRDDRPGDAKLDTDVWFAHSHDGGSSWDGAQLAGPFNLRRAAIDPTASSFLLGEVDGLAATPDGFAAAFVQAQPAAPEPPQDVFFARLSLIRRTTGGGWLLDGKGGKVNFGFQAEETDAGPVGELELNDQANGAKIHLTGVTYLGAAASSCGSFAGAGALELDGSGSYNGLGGASFRVCVQDNGDPGVGADRFSLACTAGCSYTTGLRVPDDLIDGGNVQVGEGPDGGDPRPATVVLDPLLASTGLVGQAQSFTATVYDQNQEPLANAVVVLTKTTSGGSAQTLSATTDVNGTATIFDATLAEVAEYKATARNAESNTIVLSPLG